MMMRCVDKRVCFENQMRDANSLQLFLVEQYHLLTLNYIENKNHLRTNL